MARVDGGQAEREWRVALRAAFPAALSPAVDAASAILDEPIHGIAPQGEVCVVVGAESLTIPYRIYSPVPTSGQQRGLQHDELAVSHALLTRHHDGYVRQRHAEVLLSRAEEWVAPFVVQLLGEYVIEIHEAIRDGLLPLLDTSSQARDAYRSFVIANAPFLKLTKARIASYWNCYYRSEYLLHRRRGHDGPRYPGDYPASAVLAALVALRR